MTLMSQDRVRGCGERPPGEGLTFLLLGGAFSTGNLGVSALGNSSAKGMLRAFPGAHVIIQSWGVGNEVRSRIEGREVALESSIFHYSTVFRHRAGTRHLGALLRVWRLLPPPARRWLLRCNRALEQLVRSDVVLDISGGDSFATTYGPLVFDSQTAPKSLALRMGKPLVLLPQTFGPFETEDSRAAARRIIGGAILAATREAEGLGELDDLFGGRRPPHTVACPDVAFTLDAEPVPPEEEPFVLEPSRFPTLIGINVSGTLFFGGERFGLKDPYPETVRRLVAWALEPHDTRVVLVPHVLPRPLPAGGKRTPNPPDDSDTAACGMLLEELRHRYGERLDCLRLPHSEGATKYLAGRCHFFVGARMHACIGAVDSGVPTVTLAYSKKAEGVMAHLGGSVRVVDLRDDSTEGVLRRVRSAYHDREGACAALRERLPRVRSAVRGFFSNDLRRVVLDVLERDASGGRAARVGDRR